MKILLSISLFFKRFGLILRGLALALCAVLIFKEAIPDLLFDLKTKNAPTFSEEQIIKTKKEDLPLYLKIIDVQPVGEMYVEQTSYNEKTKETRLDAIYYPVYNLKKFEDIESLKSAPCNIVIRDSKIKEEDIKSYFSKKIQVEGKYDQSTIDAESRKILASGGYNIAPNCILLQKGTEPWGIGKCLFMILAFGIFGAILLLSFLPVSALYKIFKQEQRFVRIK